MRKVAVRAAGVVVTAGSMSLASFGILGFGERRIPPEGSDSVRITQALEARGA
jgi:hypothetical protein